MNKYCICIIVSILFCGCFFSMTKVFAVESNEQRIELKEDELKEARESRLCFYKMDENELWKYTDSFQTVHVGNSDEPFLCKWDGYEWYRIYDTNNYLLIDNEIFGLKDKSTIRKFIKGIPSLPGTYDYAMFCNNRNGSYQIAYRKNETYYYINDEPVDEANATISFFLDPDGLTETLTSINGGEKSSFTSNIKN